MLAGLLKLRRVQEDGRDIPHMQVLSGAPSSRTTQMPEIVERAQPNQEQHQHGERPWRGWPLLIYIAMDHARFGQLHAGNASGPCGRLLTGP